MVRRSQLYIASPFCRAMEASSAAAASASALMAASRLRAIFVTSVSSCLARLSTCSSMKAISSAVSGRFSFMSSSTSMLDAVRLGSKLIT